MNPNANKREGNLSSESDAYSALRHSAKPEKGTLINGNHVDQEYDIKDGVDFLTGGIGNPVDLTLVENIEVKGVGERSLNENKVERGVQEEPTEINDAKLAAIREESTLKTQKKIAESRSQGGFLSRVKTMFGSTKSQFSPEDGLVLTETDIDKDNLEADKEMSEILSKLNMNPASLTKSEIVLLSDEDMSTYVNWKAQNMSLADKKAVELRNKLAFKRGSRE